ncbi:hypothetical protein BKA16_003392 [Gordonia humi]|uniref:Uncharacterized protein n=1 Tax=Gordonia humi TaxID=686429 RepID=A0A840F9K1_9ACTN|nr:hypothetical protein [Gordonia humi]
MRGGAACLIAMSSPWQTMSVVGHAATSERLSPSFSRTVRQSARRDAGSTNRLNSGQSARSLLLAYDILTPTS